MKDSRERFTATVDNYEKYRPTYPPDLIDWIVTTCGMGPTSRIADVGCGTGISTRLFAVIAHAAANHQKKPPDQGTANDIDLVSAYLPYCDAMLVDNRTRAMLERGVPKKHTLNYPCRLFSPNVGKKFLVYLKNVEAEADPLILALVRQVYGETWLKPFVTMFDA